MVRLAKLLLSVLFISGTSSIAEASGVFTYQGRIIGPTGKPIQGAVVVFKVQIKSPDFNSCLMFEETHTVDMANSDGIFSLQIGKGVRAAASIDGGLNLSQIFSNKQTVLGPFPVCDLGGGTFVPNKVDTRKMIISFNDGTGSQTIQAQEISFVPYAFEAAQLGGYSADNLLRVDGTNVPAMLNTEYQEMMKLVDGTSTTYAKAGTIGGSTIPATNTLTAGQSIRWDGTQWVAFTPETSGSAVNSISSSHAALIVTPTGGNVALNLTVGTAANTLAAGDDSRIVGAFQSATSLGGDLSGTLPNPTVTKIQGRSVSAALPSIGGILQWDSTLATWKSAVLQSCALNQTLYFDSTSDSYRCQTIGINASQITAGAVSVDRGGTGLATAPANGQLLIGNGTNYTLGNLTAGTGVSITNSAGGIQLSITGAAGNAGGDLDGTYPNPTLSTTGVTAGTYPKVTVDAKGRVTAGITTIGNADIAAAAGIVDTKLATISTAGKVSGGAITSGTIGGTTAVSTSGNITTSGRMIASATSTTNAKVEVDGQILSKVNDAGAAVAIDWNNGNLQYTTASCTNFVFSNMYDGGTYTLIVKGATAATCAFSQTTPDALPAGNFAFVPAIAPTTAGKQTVFTFLRAGTTVYVTWIAGF